MKALLVIDVQKAMIEGDSPVFQSDLVLRNIKHLIDQARKEHILIIYVQHNEDGSEFENGSRTWEIVDDIKPHKKDPIVQKRRPDSFKNTTLKSILDEHHVDELIIVGMQTEYCVNATSLKAVELGYQVSVVSDAHTTFNGKLNAEKIITQHHKKWSKVLKLVTSSEVSF